MSNTPMVPSTHAAPIVDALKRSFGPPLGSHRVTTDGPKKQAAGHG